MFPKILSVPTVNSLDNISIEAYTYDLVEGFHPEKWSQAHRDSNLLFLSVVSVPVQKVCAVQTLGPDTVPPMDVCQYLRLHPALVYGQYFST